MGCFPACGFASGCEAASGRPLRRGEHMVETRDLLSMVVFLVTFLLTGGLGVLLLLKLDRDRLRSLERLRDLAGDEGRVSGGSVLGSFLLALPVRPGACLLPAEGVARNRSHHRLTLDGVSRSTHL